VTVVNNSSTYFLAGILILTLFLTLVAWHFLFRVRQSSRLNWESIVQRLVWVDPKIVARIALDLVNESGQAEEAPGRERLEPTRIWEMIGGLDGLEKLKANSRVLIDLATHLERSYPDALVVAEELRLDARELEWHVGRLEGAAGTGNLEISFPFYAQRAIVAYYKMTRQVLALYEGKHSPFFAYLEKAL
jgi:hypothetical protein